MKQAILELSTDFALAVVTAVSDSPVKNRAFKITANAVPSGAKFVRMFPDDRKGTICIVLEHDSFPELLRGCVIPQLRPPVFSVEYP